MFEKMAEFEQGLSQMDGAVFGDDACPLKHTFGDGLYIREITMPKGMTLTSKIHKTTHPYFIIKGDVSVMTQDGPIRLKAPHWGITEAGTKRILYMHEETVWVTVHATKEVEYSEKIEEELIAETYNALPEHVKQVVIEGETI
jgi:hypothetical protein